MKSKKERKHVLWQQYFFSYIAVALFVGTMLGLFLIANSVRDMERENQKTILNKSQLIVEDMERQVNTFEEIAKDIMLYKVYKPFYAWNGGYNEIELLARFEQYAMRSKLVTDYCMFYKERPEKLYISSRNDPSGAHISYPDVFLSNLFSPDTYEATFDQICSITENTVIQADHIAIFCMYIPTGLSPSATDGNIVLCFFVPEADLIARADEVSGTLRGNYTIQYGDLQLASSNLFIQTESAVTIYSENKRFQIVVQPEKNTIWVQMSLFDSHNLIWLFLFLLITVGCVGILAWKNYEPIYHISKKCQDQINGHQKQFGNELTEIEKAMQRLIEENRQALLEQRNQKRSLIDQLLLMLLNGNYFLGIEEKLQELDVKLTGNYFMVLAIHCSAATEDVLPSDITQLIHDFSDSEMHLYTVSHPRNRNLYVLCSMTTLNQREEIIELVHNLLCSKSCALPLGIGGVYGQLNQLMLSAMDATRNTSIHPGTLDNSGDFPKIKHPLYEKIKDAVRMEDEEQTIALLTPFVTDSPDLPNFMRQYQFFAALSAVDRLAEEMDLLIPKNDVNIALTKTDCSSFLISLERIVHQLCSQIHERKMQSRSDLEAQLIAQMQAQCCQYDFSLSALAKQFGLNENMVNSIIRKKAGYGYKEYLILLRIQEAKRILVEENRSVADTCTAVGYGNISHFIKTFKKIVGQTPDAYRKRVMSLQPLAPDVLDTVDLPQADTEKYDEA